MKINYSESVGRSACSQESIAREEPEATIIGITFETLTRIMQQPKPADMLALYSFYARETARQRTQRIWSTTGFTARGLGWKEEKVRKVKKRLVSLGVVEDVPQVKAENGKYEKAYLLVRYIKSPHLPETGGPVKEGSQNGGAKCLRKEGAAERKNSLKNSTQADAREVVRIKTVETSDQARIINLYHRLLVDRKGSDFLPVTKLSPELEKALYMAADWDDETLAAKFGASWRWRQDGSSSRTLVRVLWDNYQTDEDFTEELSEF